jgi:hypothetical protein
VRACYLIIAICAFFNNLAFAQTNDEMKWALGEVGGELQLCSVYFLVLSSCLEKQEPALSVRYRTASDNISKLAISGSLAVGVSPEAYTSMAQLEAANMMKSMGNNCTNIAILLKKYMNFCQRLSNGSDARIGEWLTCIRMSRKTCDGP